MIQLGVMGNIRSDTMVRNVFMWECDGVDGGVDDGVGDSFYDNLCMLSWYF